MTADDGKPSEARLMMASLIWLDCFLHQRQSYDGLAHLVGLLPSSGG
jgi:hypothetical protein